MGGRRLLWEGKRYDHVIIAFYLHPPVWDNKLFLFELLDFTFFGSSFMEIPLLCIFLKKKVHIF